MCTLLEINDIDLFYENILSKVADKVGTPFLDKIVELGLLTDEPVLKLGSPLDTFSQFIASKLSLSTYHIIIVLMRLVTRTLLYTVAQCNYVTTRLSALYPL